MLVGLWPSLVEQRSVRVHTQQEGSNGGLSKPLSSLERDMFYLPLGTPMQSRAVHRTTQRTIVRGICTRICLLLCVHHPSGCVPRCGAVIHLLCFAVAFGRLNEVIGRPRLPSFCLQFLLYGLRQNLHPPLNEVRPILNALCLSWNT